MRTRIYRTGKAFFIDKMPNNFRHIGLIHLMLPNAKIIDARREPMACCFSNFKQLFASGQEFTYSFEDIARYYRSYIELMAHWDDAPCPVKSCGCSTKMWWRIWKATCGAFWSSAAWRSSRVRRVLQDRAQRAHRELRAGTPTDLQGGLWISGVISTFLAPLKAALGPLTGS